MSELTATQCGCSRDNCSNNNSGCSSWIWIIILLFFCGGCGNNNDCGCGFGVRLREPDPKQKQGSGCARHDCCFYSSFHILPPMYGVAGQKSRGYPLRQSSISSAILLLYTISPVTTLSPVKQSGG